MNNRYEDYYKLCLGWFIILSTYLLIDFIVIIGGFWRLNNILGILLLVLPYTVGTLYYLLFCKGKSKTFYALGLFIPTIAEKIIIYLLGAYIYNFNILDVASVMNGIADGREQIRRGLESVETYYNYLSSFFSWGYVFGGLLLSLVMTILLGRFQKGVVSKS